MSTNADLLRRAAALMRERAEAAASGPWYFNSSMEDDLHDDAAGWVGHSPNNDGFQAFIATTANHPDGFDDGAHIASWHPVVAIAVADWLDALARAVERSGVAHYPEPASIHDAALAVARAYLGEQS